MKILLLEDNQSLNEIITEMLESKHYEVDSFVDGDEVMSALTNSYDCFILDINVPNVDGLTLLKEIRDYYDEKIPVIIISSNIELDTVKTAYSKGCNDFLKKPFYIYELETKIDMLCKQKQYYYFDDFIKFDTENYILFDKNNEEIKLTHKEKLLMVLLLKKPEELTSLNSIEQYVWEGEFATMMSIRSLVKRIRAKLPQNTIETKSYGYTIHVKDKSE